MVYQVDFYPIPIVSIKLILKSSDHHKFNLDAKTDITCLHQGQLWLGSHGEDTFIGVGAFKTAHTATLILTNPMASGIGSRVPDNIMIKCPYLHRPDQFNEPPYNQLGVKKECEKLFHKANILYWAKVFFKLAEDFVTKRIRNAPEPLPFTIPSIHFIDASFTFQYPMNLWARGPKVTTVDAAYLCKEEIPDANTEFTKFIHNGNCVPLVKPGKPEYDVTQFLAFIQHVQYVKTKGLAYVSDYQGQYIPLM